MRFEDEDGLARRAFLALPALGAGASFMGAPGAASARSAGQASLIDLFADQDARTDGKPAFWLTRGREYLVRGARMTPLQDRHVLSAVRVIRTPDGGCTRPYTETAFSTMPGGADAPATLTSPITGQTYPNPIIGKVRLTLRVSAAGAISQEVRLERLKISSSYTGELSLVLGPRGAPLLACAFNARVTRPEGILDLTELGPYHPDESRRSNGFTPATRDIVVLREASAAMAGTSRGVQIGVHPTVKYDSIEAVRAALTPIERVRYADWLNHWEALLFAEADAIA